MVAASLGNAEAATSLLRAGADADLYNGEHGLHIGHGRRLCELLIASRTLLERVRRGQSSLA